MAQSPVLRVHADDLIDRETLIALRQRSSLMGVSLVFHAWAIIRPWRCSISFQIR